MVLQLTKSTVNASQRRSYRKSLCRDRKATCTTRFSLMDFCQRREIELTLRRLSSKILGLRKWRGPDRSGYRMMIRSELEDSQSNRSQ